MAKVDFVGLLFELWSVHRSFDGDFWGGTFLNKSLFRFDYFLTHFIIIAIVIIIIIAIVVIIITTIIIIVIITIIIVIIIGVVIIIIIVLSLDFIAVLYLNWHLKFDLYMPKVLKLLSATAEPKTDLEKYL